MLRFVMLACAGAALVAVSAMGAAADYKPREHYAKSPGHVPYAAHGKGGRYAPKHGGGDFVVTDSVSRARQVAGPVRVAPLGYQVRLPGGSWVYCEYSCEYTLRKNTVEFWDSQGNGNFVSPGRFRKDFYLDDLGRGYRRY
jgi:hypothetical protein